MGHLALVLESRELHEQRGGFHWHRANIYYAMAEAQRMRMDLHFGTLLQALSAYAQNVRNYRDASELFSRLAQARKSAGDEQGEAAAYHHQGMIAQEQRDFKAAENPKSGFKSPPASERRKIGRATVFATF